MQPTREHGIPPQRPGFLSQPREDNLGNVFRQMGVIDLPPSRRIDQIHIAFDDLPKGRFVTGQVALQKLAIREHLPVECRKSEIPNNNLMAVHLSFRVALVLAFAAIGRTPEPPKVSSPYPPSTLRVNWAPKS